MALVLADTARGAGNRTLAQAQAAGWDCNSLILIGGHYHCSPPGVPSVQNMLDGTATKPSIVHQVFRPDGSFAGTEIQIRADLFAGQRCPTDQWLRVPPWLPSPAYDACHHFESTPSRRAWAEAGRASACAGARSRCWCERSMSGGVPGQKPARTYIAKRSRGGRISAAATGAATVQPTEAFSLVPPRTRARRTRGHAWS